MNTFGPTTPVAQEVDADKYRLTGENFMGKVTRVAKTLSDDNSHFGELMDILGNQRFLAAGRIQAAIGSPKRVTPYNCFVSPTIEDSFVDGDNSIMDVATKAATTMRMGGGIGYDWSTLRPRGALIRKLQSNSSGPLGFMPINDAICKATSSAGNRRGAQMGVLRIDHPDIEEFIDAKKPPAMAAPILEAYDAAPAGSAEKMRWFMALQSTLSLTGYNVSVAVTDEFMHALRDKKPFALRWGGKKYREVDAGELWEKIMRNTWDWAEPGVLFIDTINNRNNLWYCERIAATNPCAEQPLPPNGACLLGSFNLVKYVHTRSDGSRYFSFEALIADIPAVVRMMDNVVDVAAYPLPEQEREAHSKRRMGLGITGLANAAEALGHAYGSPQFLDFQADVLAVIRDQCYLASIELAREKGAFPLFDREKYLAGHFVERLPENVRERIAKYGIRNSHLTSIAPTGTISLTADNVSSGIEPVFSYSQKRLINTPAGKQTYILQDYGVREFGVRGRRAKDVTAQQHVDVLATAYRFVDSAVSKTCNVDGSMSWDDFKGLYYRAWMEGCKGCTTYNKDGKRAGILVDIDEDKEVETPSCEIDPVTGKRSCE